MKKDIYTKEEVLDIIFEAFWDGWYFGERDLSKKEVEEKFDANFYLLEEQGITIKNMNDNQKPENMDEIYSKEKIEFLCQYKIRSSVLRVLKEKFDVRELLVIREKDKESK